MSSGPTRLRTDATREGAVDVKSAAAIFSWERLQRPPPVTRIFLPGLGRRSAATTDAPLRAAPIAAARPAAPAPITATSRMRDMSPAYRNRRRGATGDGGVQKLVLKTGRTFKPAGLSRTMLTRPSWTPLTDQA